MRDYYLTIKANDVDTINELMQNASYYDCDIHIDKEQIGHLYKFNFNEVSYQKLGERVGRTTDEYKKDMEYFNFVSNILEAFGLSPAHKGFRYAVECIRLINTYGLENYTMERDVYPIISKWYETTASSVEHNIRNAINNSWIKNCNSLKSDKNEMSVFKRKPTNVKFLKHISRLTFLAYIGAY